MEQQGLFGDALPWTTVEAGVTYATGILRDELQANHCERCGERSDSVIIHAGRAKTIRVDGSPIKVPGRAETVCRAHRHY
jgi:hypothetical protein